MKIKNIKIYTGLLTLLITGATLTGCYEKKSDLHGDQSEYQQPEHRAEIVNGIPYDEFGNEISLEEFEKKFYKHRAEIVNGIPYDEFGNEISLEEFEKKFHINHEKKSKTK